MVTLYRPNYADLWFRKEYLADAATMSYNHAWGGTIEFPETAWEAWYRRWVACADGKRFFRYLREEEPPTFVGEVAYCFDEAEQAYMANILVYAKYRGNGYGRRGLQLLCEAARDNGIACLYDKLAIDNPAIQVLSACGFAEQYRTDEIVLLKKPLGDGN